jgi:hypothetical protein
MDSYERARARATRTTYRVPTYGRVRSQEHRMHWGCLGGLLLAALAVVIFGSWFWQMEYGTQHTVTFTVTQLDDQSTGSSGHKYLVFGKLADGRPVVFENTDAWLHGKTDSSDIQAALNQQVGKTITCPVYGYRNHLFSSYQDILDGCKLASGQPLVSQGSVQALP